MSVVISVEDYEKINTENTALKDALKVAVAEMETLKAAAAEMDTLKATYAEEIQRLNDSE